MTANVYSKHAVETGAEKQRRFLLNYYDDIKFTASSLIFTMPRAAGVKPSQFIGSWNSKSTAHLHYDKQ